jgi:hypothetical protein
MFGWFESLSEEAVEKGLSPPDSKGASGTPFHLELKNLSCSNERGDANTRELVSQAGFFRIVTFFSALTVPTFCAGLI